MTTSTSVKTRSVQERRSLRFGRIEDIVGDVAKLDEHVAAGGSIRTTGNWTAAQIVAHVATLLEMSLDGFPGKAPAVMRFFGRMLKDSALNKPMRPGFGIPRSFADIAPDGQVPWEDAVAKLRAAAGRIVGGERMTIPSPILGPLSHEQWIQFQCRHAEMHFSFMHLAE